MGVMRVMVIIERVLVRAMMMVPRHVSLTDSVGWHGNTSSGEVRAVTFWVMMQGMVCTLRESAPTTISRNSGGSAFGSVKNVKICT